jgi:hypothetical protein
MATSLKPSAYVLVKYKLDLENVQASDVVGMRVEGRVLRRIFGPKKGEVTGGRENCKINGCTISGVH